MRFAVLLQRQRLSLQRQRQRLYNIKQYGSKNKKIRTG